METYKVKPEEQGKRLDTYVTNQNNELTRTAVQRLVEQEKILVNGKKQKVAYKVTEGDMITIEETEAKTIKLKAQEIPIDIIYEDKDIIVVNTFISLSYISPPSFFINSHTNLFNIIEHIITNIVDCLLEYNIKTISPPNINKSTNLILTSVNVNKAINTISTHNISIQFISVIGKCSFILILLSLKYCKINSLISTG